MKPSEFNYGLVHEDGVAVVYNILNRSSTEMREGAFKQMHGDREPPAA